MTTETAATVYMTKSDHAYWQIRQHILSGSYAPGSIINQEYVAADLGVSTTPVREALRRLKAEGLVELGAHRDARVMPMSATEAQDLLEVRHGLDLLAAGLAAERRTDADVVQINAAADRMRSLIGGSDSDTLEAHRTLHTCIYRASHNEILVELLDALWDRYDRYRRLGLAIAASSNLSRAGHLEDHFLLVDAIIRADISEAQSLMQRHADQSVGAVATRELLRLHAEAGEIDVSTSPSPSGAS